MREREEAGDTAECLDKKCIESVGREMEKYDDGYLGGEGNDDPEFSEVGYR